jgi:hypothetical protein
MLSTRSRIFLILLALTIVLGWPAQAAVIDEVVGDFTPISGYVIMEAEGEYLIDLDVSKGIAAGDLFSVIKPGEKISHPVTGKVLGTLEEVKGILKVSRLQSGYSFARLLEKSTEIKRGDPIRRYTKMSATLWDYTGRGETFFIQLRDQLSDLKWEDYQASQRSRPDKPRLLKAGGPNLIFILTSSGLEVRDSEFQIIHSYGPPESLVSVAPVAAVPPSTKKAPTGSKPEEGITYKPTYQGYQTVAELSTMTLMADFVKDGDDLLMAATDGSEVKVYKVGPELSLRASGRPKGMGDTFAVKWWRPTTTAALHLAVNTITDDQVEATVFRLEGKELLPVEERISFFVGTFDRDGDGLPETLLRQSFDRDIFWGSQIRELQLIDGRLKHIRPKLKLPRRFTVLGSTFADLTGDGKTEIIFIRDKALYIYAGKKQLYKSPAEVGGSLAVATYELDPGASFTSVKTAILEISPVAVDVDGDGQLEVLAVTSDRGMLKSPQLNVHKSWLAVIKYKDSNFVKGTFGETLEIPTQGLAADEGRVLVVASRPGSVFGKEASSRILAYPLVR